jgi:2-oxoglutarate ferredoxin oxidoreductase subunit delta
MATVRDSLGGSGGTALDRTTRSLEEPVRMIGLAEAKLDVLPPDGATDPTGSGGAAPAPFQPVLVDVDRCKGCALCVAVCPKGILALDETRVNVQGYHPVHITNPAACTSDAHCARVCPDCALTILARPRIARGVPE